MKTFEVPSPGGCTRAVLLVGGLAIKVPQFRMGWRLFLLGLLANMQERDFARLRWPELCPVVLALRGGWLLIMRRASPMSLERWVEFDAVAWRERPDGRIPVEIKRDSFGILDGRIVAVDYGS